ncbi:MAG: helix-turn-helix domain-containing protein [Myxococcota bacterium]
MLVPAAAAIAILDGFEAAGGNAQPIREALGAALASPEGALPLERWLPFFDTIATAEARCTWGLEVGLSVPYGSFGLVDYLVASAPSVRGALRSLETYFDGFAARLGIEVEDSPEELIVRIEPQGGTQWSVDFSLGVIISRARALAGEENPIAVIDLGKRPRAPEYEQLLAGSGEGTVGVEELSSPRVRTRITFGAERAFVRIAGKMLDQPLSTTEERLHSSLTGVVSAMLEDRRSIRVTDTTLRALRTAPTKDATTIARCQGMSERTLSRRLAGEETSFRELQDRVRAEESERRLLRGETFAEIAIALGYGDQSAWTKAFKRWKGIPPGAWMKSRANT